MATSTAPTPLGPQSGADPATGELATTALIRELLDTGSFRRFRLHDAATHDGAMLDEAAHDEAAFGGSKFDEAGCNAATYDGVVAATGLVTGNPVAVFAQDPTFCGGSIGAEHGRQIAALQEYALAQQIPIIGIWNGGGARIQEGVHALTAVGQIFHNNVAAKGIIPQISLVLGTCAGAACYSPALTDFTIVTAASRMFLTGPAVTADVIGEVVTAEELGGPGVHAHNGVADYVAPTNAAAFAYARQLLAYLVSTSATDQVGVSTPRDLSRGRATDQVPVPTSPTVNEEISTSRGHSTGQLAGEVRPLLPESPTQPYDVVEVLSRVFDAGSWLEVQPAYARNLVTRFARLGGQPVAIVACQPNFLAGTLDADAADKGARFITTAASFGLPIITFMDVPGFLPGLAQEQAGVIRRGANLVAAYLKAQVPKFTVIMRKGYGGAYIALGSKPLGANQVFAWPDAEIAVMGAAGAIDVLHHRALAQLNDDAATATKLRAELVDDFRAHSPGLTAALASGQVAAVINPSETRQVLIGALSVCLNYGCAS